MFKSEGFRLFKNHLLFLIIGLRAVIIEEDLYFILVFIEVIFIFGKACSRFNPYLEYELSILIKDFPFCNVNFELHCPRIYGEPFNNPF